MMSGWYAQFQGRICVCLYLYVWLHGKEETTDVPDVGLPPPPLFIHMRCESSSRNYQAVAVIFWFLEYQTYRNTSQERQDTADNPRMHRHPITKLHWQLNPLYAAFLTFKLVRCCSRMPVIPHHDPRSPESVSLCLIKLSLKRSSAEKNTRVSTYRE